MDNYRNYIYSVDVSIVIISVKQMNKKFDVYAINLERRLDRRQNVLDQFKALDFCNVKFFKAIEHNKGWIGCALSHLELIKFAKKNNMDYIIVIEDDILINESISSERFNKVLSYLTKHWNKYEIFNGSPSFWIKRNDTNAIKKTKSLLPKFSLVSDAQKTTFMIYTKKSYDKILDYDPYLTSIAIDEFFAKNFMQLCYRKYLCYEIKSYSNIQNHLGDLEQYMRDQEKLFQELPEKE